MKLINVSLGFYQQIRVYFQLVNVFRSVLVLILRSLSVWIEQGVSQLRTSSALSVLRTTTYSKMIDLIR